MWEAESSCELQAASRPRQTATGESWTEDSRSRPVRRVVAPTRTRLPGMSSSPKIKSITSTNFSAYRDMMLVLCVQPDSFGLVYPGDMQIRSAMMMYSMLPRTMVLHVVLNKLQIQSHATAPRKVPSERYSSQRGPEERLSDRRWWRTDQRLIGNQRLLHGNLSWRRRGGESGRLRQTWNDSSPPSTTQKIDRPDLADRHGPRMVDRNDSDLEAAAPRHMGPTFRGLRCHNGQ